MPFHKLVWLGVALAPLFGTALPPPSNKCQRKCGGVDIPYPFGIVGPDSPDNCAMAPDFRLSCNETVNGGRRPFYFDVEVVGVSLQQGQARMRMGISSYCYNTTTGEMFSSAWIVDLKGTSYRFSDTNKFTVIGCKTLAYIINDVDDGDDGRRHHRRRKYRSGCVAMCERGDGDGDDDVRSTLSNGSCSGIGCCQTAIPKGLQHYDVSFDPGFNTMEIHNVSRCSYAVLMDSSNFTFLTSYATSPAFNDTYGGQAPVVVDWHIGNERCDAARKKPWSYACVSDNSECFNSLNGPGYICNCSKGFQGNPYLQDLEHGCKDINECTDLGYPCSVPGTCQNLPGGFECLPGEKLGIGHQRLGLIIGLSVASGPCVLILVLGALLITRDLKQRKGKTLRRKFFTQNRGQLLKQLVSHRADIAERMLISLEELEEATNNFDHARRLGGGGHGTVYKGILPDLHVVAIKKSNIVVRREIDEFINEVAILSQINHRNIVKLRGCCLETEVPLLAYEFISNGTLSDHLHTEEPVSLPWKDRLRITTEIGKAIAYLHSAISIPIIHRDIKPSNILLDDTLIAKLSDFGASRYIPMDQTGTTTAVQGTIGYLDPMYYYTGQLTESSDVYSFGVLLTELLTRRNPSSYRSSQGDGLVMQFVALLEDGNLTEILDPQVVEEGGSEIEEIASLAVSCMKLRVEERPTMRQVEMVLETLQAPKKVALGNSSAEKDEGKYAAMGYALTSRRTNRKETSRRHSLEEEFMLSARYPR